MSVGVSGPPLFDAPGGVFGTQFPLQNPAAQVFTTIVAQQPVLVAVVEDFTQNSNEDQAFVPRYNAADWNKGNSGRLEGISLAAGPLGPASGGRQQFTISPPPPTPGYFEPFDDGVVNNHPINIRGGSRSMFHYFADGSDLPAQIFDSIELIEFQPSVAGGAGIVFPGVSMRAGHMTRDSSFPGMTSSLLFDDNYDFDNPQNAWIDPGGSGEEPITVVSPQPFAFPALPGAFVPFPVFDVAFDFDTRRSEVAPFSGQPGTPDFVFDIDLPPPVPVTGTFVLGSIPAANLPLRRLTGPSGANFALNSDSVVYGMRFTFVDKNSSARTAFFDSGNADPNYETLSIIPEPASRPAGTSIRVLIEGADTIPSGVTTGEIELVDRFGNLDPTAFDAVSGSRFFRLVFEFEANHVTSQVPGIDGFIVGLSF